MSAEWIALGLLGIVLLLGIASFALVHGRPRSSAGPPLLEDGAIEFRGQRRTFTFCRPTGDARGKRYPIVMLLHGGFGSGLMAAEQTGLPDYVDAHRFIAVFPDAGNRPWDDGRETTETDYDDVGFVVALVRHVADKYGGDADRAFLAGGSNGGMLAQRVACEATDAFRAYASVVATLPLHLSKRCRPSRRVPFLFFLGRDDPGVRWEGGVLGGSDEERARRQKGERVSAGGTLLSAPATIRFWADQGEGSISSTVEDLPAIVDDGTSIRVHTHKGRGSQGDVILYEIKGGGHGWPGSKTVRGEVRQAIIGNQTRQINFPEVMIDFFARYGL